MTFDPEKMSPAPWHVAACKPTHEGRDSSCERLRLENGKAVQFDRNTKEFAAMARNAYHYQRKFNISAVSMRRINTFYWVVRLQGGYDMPLKFIVTQPHRGEFICPIEAVCVAGKWLEENPTEVA